MIIPPILLDYNVNAPSDNDNYLIFYACVPGQGQEKGKQKQRKIINNICLGGYNQFINEHISLWDIAIFRLIVIEL